jgi:hypothetical protein
MERVLATCPGEPLAQPDPQDGHSTPQSTQQPTKHATSKPAQSSGNDGAEVYYENCDAVRASGPAPIHRGDPGYGSHLTATATAAPATSRRTGPAGRPATSGLTPVPLFGANRSGRPFTG